MLLRRYPPPGKLYDLSAGLQLHLFEQGGRGATAIFEAGISGSCLSWSLTQPLVAKFARAVSYDRAGLGWSGGQLTARTVPNMVGDMAALFERAQLKPPYILVGHSFGCLLIRGFAHAHPTLTGGLVMVDPVTIDGWANASAAQIHRLHKGAMLAGRGAWLAQAGVVRATLSALLSGQQALPKAVSRISSGQGDNVVKRLVQEVRKLPEEVQPMVAYHWSRAQSFRALAAYLKCLPDCAREARALPMNADLPCIILSAEHTSDSEFAERTSWIAGNSSARQVRVPGTTHWLQLERPDVVAEAVQELAALVR